MLDDLDAAGRWVDEWESAVAQRAAKAQDLSRRLTALTATAHDEDRLITVTVGASGTVTALTLDERVRQQSAAETARRILATMRAAQADVMAQVTEATGQAYGPDSATSASILASYRDRSAGPDAAR